jgi:PAS domain S-box-containing protein
MQQRGQGHGPWAIEPELRGEQQVAGDAAWLELVLEALDAPLIIFDPDGRPVRASPAARELLGVDPVALGAAGLADHVLRVLRLRARGGRTLRLEELPVRPALRGEPVRDLLFEITDAEGAGRTLSVTARPLRSDGRIRGAVVVWSDVTGRLAADDAVRRAADAVDRSEARYRGVAAGVPGAAVCVVDRELRYLLAEGQLLADLGFAPGALEGRRVQDVLAGDIGVQTAELFRRALAGETVPSESRWNGRTLLTHYGPLRGPAGVESAVSLTIDITERKQAEDELRANEERARALEAARKEEAEREAILRRSAESAVRAKDEFLAMLGHELRNPLAPILTAVQILSQRLGDGSARELAVIERQTRHMSRLVEDLLDVSRITRGSVKLERADLDLRDVLTRAIEVASPLLEERAHELELAVPPDLRLEGDEERLVQVFSNLLTNAAKYSPPRGRISVRAERAAGFVRVSVADRGIGIAPDLLPRLFDLFVQGDRRLDRAQGGLGLGLALVKALTLAHGGRVEARSAGLGQGSEFVVELPLGPAAPALAAPGSAARVAADAGRVARRVLVVDDNRDAAELLAEGLRLHGHDVRVAFDGPGALEIARELDPEVALLDIGLPVMNGYEVARRLRERGTRCHLVAVTGYGQEADRIRAREHGFDAHVVKPIDLERMRELVRQAGRG